MRSYMTCIIAAILLVAIAGTAQAQEKKPANDPMRTRITDPSKTTFGGAMFTDVKQGGGPTCWIDASIAAMAHSGRDLSRLIHYEGKNVYTVALYNPNNKDNRATGGYHRITEKVAFNGRRIDADPQFDPLQPGESWVIILHRAVIQAVAKWEPTQNIKSPHGGDAADALATLTGRRPQDVPIKDTKLQQKVASALATHKTVVFGTSGKAKKLVAGHVYAVLATDAQGVTIYNPWGSVDTFSWRMIRQDGEGFAILGH